MRVRPGRHRPPGESGRSARLGAAVHGRNLHGHDFAGLVFGLGRDDEQTEDVTDLRMGRRLIRRRQFGRQFPPLLVVRLQGEVVPEQDRQPGVVKAVGLVEFLDVTVEFLESVPIDPGVAEQVLLGERVLFPEIGLFRGEARKHLDDASIIVPLAGPGLLSQGGELRP